MNEMHATYTAHYEGIIRHKAYESRQDQCFHSSMENTSCWYRLSWEKKSIYLNCCFFCWCLFAPNWNATKGKSGESEKVWKQGVIAFLFFLVVVVVWNFRHIHYYGMCPAGLVCVLCPVWKMVDTKLPLTARLNRQRWHPPSDSPGAVDRALWKPVLKTVGWEQKWIHQQGLIHGVFSAKLAL